HPAAVLERAIDGVIRRHKWATPPLIAEVEEQVQEDALYFEQRRLNDYITMAADEMTRIDMRDEKYAERRRIDEENHKRMVEEFRQKVEAEKSDSRPWEERAA